MNILITGACGVTSRSVCRSIMLSEAFGTSRIIGADIASNAYGLYEGLYEMIYRVPGVYDSNYLPVLTDICQEASIDIAIVVPEPEVLFWTEHRMPVPAFLPPPLFSRVAVSKRKVYESLRARELVPSFSVASREEILNIQDTAISSSPLWMRDCSEGSTSGKGAIMARSVDEMKAWAMLNENIDTFMISAFLPGRSFACTLLFFDGVLRKVACYERLEYFMGQRILSGVSGNISRGRLINNKKICDAAETAVRHITQQTDEKMHGLVTVDLKADADSILFVTEINLRHVACTSSFAQGGANMAEAHIFATLGDIKRIGICEVQFPRENLILRDIDGEPIFVRNYREIAIGESLDRRLATVEKVATRSFKRKGHTPTAKDRDP